MREILFRGQRVTNKDFVYGDFIHGVGWKKGQSYILPVVHNLASLTGCDPIDGFEVIPETVSQLLFTNGQGQFFDGDNIRYIIKEDGDIYKKGEVFLEGKLQQTPLGPRVVRQVPGGHTITYLAEQTMIGKLDLECFHLLTP